MRRSATRLVKATLDLMHFSGASRLLAPYTRGAGVIFMLHHVTPEQPHPFEPNRILKIMPEFLTEVVGEARRQGFDIVSLDEVHRRMQSGAQGARPFCAFTFDDGYRDNYLHAWPVLNKLDVPFTIYVPTDFPDGNGFLWWLVLERVVRVAASVTLSMDGAVRHLSCRTTAAKDEAFASIYWWLRALPEHRARAVVAELAAGAGIDPAAACRELVMSWDELRTMANDPLVTIGAHTRGHFALAKLSAEEARAEMAGSIARIEQEIGRPCRHFSFPYGDAGSADEREFALAADLGIATAVTTRKGVVAQSSRLTALPRVSLNGDYQQARYVKVFLSGAPFAMLNVLSGRAHAAG
jgi:peptidoglycan/xylan/chitin deacetylase (PgdA/CDA1 family)